MLSYSGMPKINGDLSHSDLNDYGKITQMVDYWNEGSEGVLGKCKDYYGHGTHVAGVIGANTNNDTGVAGIANGCKIYIYKVFDQNGNVIESYFKNAVMHAVASGVNVINYSGSTVGTQLTTDALWYANGNNQYGRYVTIVAAAGNSGAGTGEIVSPAIFSGSYSNVIAVGATDQNDIYSYYSSYGWNLNVVAPGGYGLAGQAAYNSDDIYSTTPNYPFTKQGGR